MDLYLLGIGTILIGGFVSTVLPERLKSWAVMSFTGAGASLLILLSVQVLMGQTPVLSVYTLSYPIGEVVLCVDHLSAFFIIVISAVSFLGTLYAIGYMRPYYGKGGTITSHFFFLAVLIASMLAVTLVQNALAFLIVWEIMSLSSFFLVAFENERTEVYQAAINYLIAMHVGVLFLMGGFLVAAHQSGSFDFHSFTKAFEENRGMANLVFVLLFIGFGTKAGFMPLHTWLPKAHPAAPSHVSGLMSGVMIKTGIYGILRTLLLIRNPAVELAYFVLAVSLISGVLGVAYPFRKACWTAASPSSPNRSRQPCCWPGWRKRCTLRRWIRPYRRGVRATLCLVCNVVETCSCPRWRPPNADACARPAQYSGFSTSSRPTLPGRPEITIRK